MLHTLIRADGVPPVPPPGHGSFLLSFKQTKPALVHFVNQDLKTIGVDGLDILPLHWGRGRHSEWYNGNTMKFFSFLSVSEDGSKAKTFP